MVSAITEAVISTVHGVGRILYLRPFNEYVGTSVTDGPNIQDIVRSSRAFRTTSVNLSTKVEADFAEAEVRMSAWKTPCTPMALYVQGTTLIQPAYMRV